MNTDFNNIDSQLLEEDNRIDSYLKGKMSAEEEMQFMKELEEKPEMKEKAIAAARLVKGLKEVGVAQDQEIMDAFLASSEDSVVQAAKNAISNQADLPIAATIPPKQPQTELPAAASNTVPLRRAITWLSIAASVAIIIWLGVEYSIYRNTTALGYEYGEAFSSGTIIRGDATPSEAEKKLEKLFAEVKEDKNIEDAIHELSLCWELSTMENYNDYTDYSAEIGWNLAIAYLKDNNKKDAKVVLEKLIATTEDGNAINTKAKELLDQI